MPARCSVCEGLGVGDLDPDGSPWRHDPGCGRQCFDEVACMIRALRQDRRRAPGRRRGDAY